MMLSEVKVGIDDRERDRKCLLDYPDYKRDEHHARYEGAKGMEGG